MNATQNGLGVWEGREERGGHLIREANSEEGSAQNGGQSSTSNQE